MEDGRNLQTRLHTYECPTSSYQGIHLHVDFALVLSFFGFIKGSERGNSVHMTLMGMKKKRHPYLGIWYKSKVIIFKSKLGSDSLAGLVLQHRLWGDAPRPTYQDAILQSVQTGAAGAGFALHEAGTEKCPGSDTCACKPNTLHRDLVLLWLPFSHLSVSIQPRSTSSAPPDLATIMFAVYSAWNILFWIFFFLNPASLSVLSFEVTS